MLMQYLDVITTVLGLIYIWMEYRASIWLWAVGILMPLLDIALYWSHGLYGDAAMAVYYTLAAVYGLLVWRFGKRKRQKGHQEAEKDSTPVELAITRMPLRLYLPTTASFFAAWALSYWVLSTYTNSTVPVLDGFTNALSFVGLWALARKFIEQWFFWIVVDVVSCYLYVGKDIPFKAGLYGLYVVIAISGYFNWKRMMATEKA